MKPIPAALLPHAVLSERKFCKILSLFAPLKVFLPWRMDPSETLVRGHETGLIRILRPPADLDPGEGLKKALETYSQWIKTHPDRSDLGFLKTGVTPGRTEDPIWVIRQQLRRDEIAHSQKETGDSFRHHLVLHLEHEFEAQRSEADRILDRLRQSKSPLNGVTEDPEEIRSLFQDLPGFNWAAESDRGDPYPVMTAWLGLFGDLLEPGDFIISPDGRYVDFLVDLWIETAGPPHTPPPMVRFPCPCFSGPTIESIAEMRRKEINADAALGLYRLLVEQQGRPDTDQEALSRRAEEMTRLPYEGPEADKAVVTAVFLPPLPDTPGPARLKRPPAEFLGRTLIFLEDEP